MSFSRIRRLNVILNQEKSKSRTLTMVTKPHFSLRLRIATDERSIWKRCIESRIYTLREWKWVTFQGHRDNRTYSWPKPFIHPFSSLPNTPDSFEVCEKQRKHERPSVQRPERRKVGRIPQLSSSGQATKGMNRLDYGDRAPTSRFFRRKPTNEGFISKRVYRESQKFCKRMDMG
jgi:hypothetical protein